jgi:hypothetical protein
MVLRAPPSISFSWVRLPRGSFSTGRRPTRSTPKLVRHVPGHSGRESHVAAAVFFRGIGQGARLSVEDVQGYFESFWNLETA